MTVISLNPLPSTYHLSCLPLNYLPPSHRPSKYFHLECISSELDWKYDTHSIYTRDGSVWRLSYTLEMPPIRGYNFLYKYLGRRNCPNVRSKYLSDAKLGILRNISWNFELNPSSCYREVIWTKCWKYKVALTCPTDHVR